MAVGARNTVRRAPTAVVSTFMVFQSKIDEESTGAAARSHAVTHSVVPAAIDAISNSRRVTMRGSFHCG